MSNIPKKNFGLSSSEFEEMTQKLREEESQKFFEHIFIEHFVPCQQKLMRGDQAPEHLAYDATMDAFISFRHGILKGKVKYGNLNWLLFTMVRQHYFKMMRKPVPIALSSVPELPQIEEKQEFSEDFYLLLRKGWNTLGEQCRNLLRRLYYYDRSYQSLAEAANQTQAVMRKRKQRCLEKLRKAAVGPDQTTATK